MRFTSKDTVATAFVAAVVLIYVGYFAFDGIPLVRDLTGVAAVGLILGFAFVKDNEPRWRIFREGVREIVRECGLA